MWASAETFPRPSNNHTPNVAYRTPNVAYRILWRIRDSAWIRKERLLRFDREFARRTEVFDDQEDFLGPAARERTEALTRRAKQTLRLDV